MSGDENGKPCPQCKRLLPREAFYVRRDDGSLHSRCKSCASARGKEAKRKRRAEGRIPYETASHRRMRLALLAHYSGGVPTCACCGETRIEFLSLDHVNGGGARHRAGLRGNASRSIYRDLTMRGYPPGFRVLCHNCNLAIGLYGYCPHAEPMPDNDTNTARWLVRPGRRHPKWRPDAKHENGGARVPRRPDVATEGAH